MKKLDKVELFAAAECWEFKLAHPEEFESFGCGPGGLGDFLVPDTIYGLSVKPCCQIHDWYYRFYGGNTEVDRELADRVFKNNMVRVVKAKTTYKWLLRLRLRRVKTYYAAVRFAGASAFFEERNFKNEVEAVELPKVKLSGYLSRDRKGHLLPKRKLDI